MAKLNVALETGEIERDALRAQIEALKGTVSELETAYKGVVERGDELRKELDRVRDQRDALNRGQTTKVVVVGIVALIVGLLIRNGN